MAELERAITIIGAQLDIVEERLRNGVDHSGMTACDRIMLGNLLRRMGKIDAQVTSDLLIASIKLVDENSDDSEESIRRLDESIDGSRANLLGTVTCDARCGKVYPTRPVSEVSDTDHLFWEGVFDTGDPS